ncbi:ABC transporter permease [Oligoflexus tunisiensis]|uniref:ABC transporter permease n=1 Tax=Oligoflexus tunisiensis TaxID=708132 RepID=UPI00114C952A|nr:ABC transporter permease [Oligoflexus tunisiensis]
MTHLDQSISTIITPNGIRRKKHSLRHELISKLSYLESVMFITLADLKSRIFGKSLGVVWLLVEPAISASLYYLLTAVIFNAAGNKHHFLFILISVIFWRWFSKTIDSSPNALISFASILKQTNFPVQVGFFSFVITETCLFLINFTVLVFFLTLNGFSPNLAYFQLPLLIITQLLLTYSLALYCAIVGTFFKDLGSFLYALTTVWWYLSPGIYPVSKIPYNFRWLFELNPFAHFLPGYRSILLDGEFVSLTPFLIISLGAIGLAALGTRLLSIARYRFFSFL